jgi:hypothetical protein
MTHLTEEELIAHYYAGRGGAGRGDSDRKAFRIAQRHLDLCGECAAKSAKLADEMKSMDGLEHDELSLAYGESVWNRVAERLPALAMKEAPRRRMPWGLMLGWAGASAVLIIGAFEIGRMWEHRQNPQNAIVKSTAPVQQVVVVVLGDHLDRTERLLVELKHADGEDPDVVKPIRDEARSLLAANHVFREDADKSGDLALTQALDHLDHLLADVANAPEGLNAASIARLQKEMQAEGLLFKVRVLRSRNPHREMTARIAAKGGAA